VAVRTGYVDDRVIEECLSGEQRETEDGALRVIPASEGDPAPYYRVSQLSCETVDELRAGIASEDGRSTVSGIVTPLFGLIRGRVAGVGMEVADDRTIPGGQL
jgi:hypothetical protein